MKNWKIFKSWWWHSTGFHLPRLFWEGIKSTIKWLPITWNDRDWDHAYIMYALRFKIKNTADYIEKHNRYEGCERDVERMRLCVRLFDALEKDIYEGEYLDYYETESHVDEEGYYKSTPIRDDLETYLKKYPSYYRRLSDKDKERNVWAALMIGHNRNKKASDLLFELIKRNIYHWWD
jgi:hypothetical protein